MRLTNDDIRINVGGEQIALRASLRAAVSLSETYGDFNTIVRGIHNEELGTIAKVVAAASLKRNTVPELLACLSGASLRALLDQLIPATLEVVNRLLDLEEPSQKVRPTTSRRVSFATYFTRLFEQASGNLGWPPGDAWNATPQEVLAAMRGRNALLRSIFGGDEPPDDSEERDPDALDVLRAIR